MKNSRILFPLGLLAAIGSTAGAVMLSGPRESGPPAPPPVAPIPSEPYTLTMPDCESDAGAHPPCLTFDESTWRVVTSYEPYRFMNVAQCNVEDGGPVIPCVWRNRVAETGEWLVYVNRFDIGGGVR